MLGGTCVGKTALVMRKRHGRFFEGVAPTIGVSMERETVESRHAGPVTITLTDTAGQESFMALTRMYFRGAAVAMLVITRTNPADIKLGYRYLDELRANAPDTRIVLVDNKSDLEPVVEQSEVEALEHEVGVTAIRTSALSGEGVAEAFNEAFKQAIEFVDEEYLEMHPQASAAPARTPARTPHSPSRASAADGSFDLEQNVRGKKSQSCKC